jgi:hypothetical protein
MSHGCAPARAILLLGQRLADNPAGTLTAKQVSSRTSPQPAGSADAHHRHLDLSKIESGR